jgi:hypothetical protein
MISLLLLKWLEIIGQFLQLQLLQKEYLVILGI